MPWVIKASGYRHADPEHRRLQDETDPSYWYVGPPEHGAWYFVSDNMMTTFDTHEEACLTMVTLRIMPKGDFLSGLGIHVAEVEL